VRRHQRRFFIDPRPTLEAQDLCLEPSAIVGLALLEIIPADLPSDHPLRDFRVALLDQIEEAKADVAVDQAEWDKGQRRVDATRRGEEAYDFLLAVYSGEKTATPEQIAAAAALARAR